MFSNPDSDPTETFRIADAATATFTELGDALGLAVATRLRSLAFKSVGREADAYVEAERALAYADASGHQQTRRRVVATLVYALTKGPAPVPEGIKRCEQLLETYSDDPVLGALVARALAALFAMAGRVAEAQEQADTSLPLLDELKQITASGVYRSIAAETKELIGDRAGAAEELEAMWLHLRDARPDGGPDGRAMAAAYKLAFLQCDEGRWDTAAEWLTYGQDVPDATPPDTTAVFRLAVSARLAAHDGRVDEAVALAERAVEISDRSDRLNHRAKVWLALSEVRRAAGDRAEADAALAAALRLYDEKGNVAAAGRLRSAASRAAS
jgi:tetratricopeptide (TPR) repeat protein